jgi:uncharacterized protein YifE (UPF0438 family)
MEIWKVPENVNFTEKFQLKKLKHTEYKLSWNQKIILRKNGTRYKELMDGIISPFSPTQRHFVDVCNGIVEPNNKFERIWKSYLSTLEEEKRLEEIHRAKLRESPRNKEHLKALCFADDDRILDNAPINNLKEQNDISEDHTRKCPSCRGSGMKGDGDNCNRCDGWGWIDAD